MRLSVKSGFLIALSIASLHGITCFFTRFRLPAMITTRSFIAQRRGTVLRYLRAYVRGMHRFKSDKEFAKKTYGKFAQITDDSLLEANWQEYANHMLRSPRPTIRGFNRLSIAARLER
jgi:hypothetical protein